MGWNPVKDVKRGIKRAGQTIERTINNPTRAITTTIGMAAGPAGALVGNYLGKKLTEKPPGYQMNKNLAQAQRDLIAQQIKDYNEFNPQQYVEGESSQLRNRLAQDVQESQRNLRGQANAAGMYHSGRRKMLEGKAALQGEEQFANARESLIRSALNKQRALEIAPILTKINAQSALASQASQLQALNEKEDASRSALMGAGFELMGRGAGSYFGAQDSGSNPARQQFLYSDQPMPAYNSQYLGRIGG